MNPLPCGRRWFGWSLCTLPYYTNLAQNLLRAGRWDEAEAMLRKAIELQPSAA